MQTTSLAPQHQKPASRHQALGYKNSSPGSRLQALDSRLSTPGSRLQALDSRLSTPSSRLQAPGSRLQAPLTLYTPKNAHNGQIGDRVQSAHTLSQPALLSLHQYDRVFFDS